MDPVSPGAPHLWLGGLCRELDRRLVGAHLQGVLSGRGWMSLRLDDRFLWLMALPQLRAIWLDRRGIPRAWAEVLGRHRRPPLEGPLRQRRVEAVQLVADEEGLPGGMLLRLDDGGGLGIRLWPRPPLLWVQDREDRIVGTSPPNEQLHPPHRLVLDEPPSIAFDEHAGRCRSALEALVENMLRRRLKAILSGRADKASRLVDALGREREQARADAGLRAQADILAAHLHQLEAGRSQLEVEDFEGRPVTIPLDPALSPAENLERLYHRARRAERASGQLERRWEEARARQEEARRQAEALADAANLDALLAIARREGVELRPPTPGQARRSAGRRRERLPYRVFELTSGRQVWVGRSARDNDELTLHRAAGDDLWLHAGGVEGSHVILRAGSSPPQPWEVEAAARLAARFSRARHSTTVAVWVTEKRHVRKPRKSAPGVVAPQRVRTIFVDPHEETEGRWLHAGDED